MSRSVLSLAAAAQAALPGSEIVGAQAAHYPGDYDAAEVRTSDNKSYLVYASRSATAGADQQADLAVLRELRFLAADGRLPFMIPEFKGTSTLSDGGRAVVTTVINGTPLQPELLMPGPGLAANIGRAIAAIHEISTGIAERLGLESYSADEYRQRHLAQLDAVAETGRIPPVLFERWESALDDVSLWRFNEVFSHGDLGPEYMLTTGDKVSEVFGWANARVADPADDLAWLLGATSPEAADSIIESYQMGRSEVRDPRLIDRAMFLNELAIARWLQYGILENNPEIIADAEAMLADLEAAI